MTQRSKNNINQVEAEMRQKLGAGWTLREIVVGLHNALAHGDALIENGFEFEEDDFTMMMVHLSNAIETAGKLSN